MPELSKFSQQRAEDLPRAFHLLNLTLSVLLILLLTASWQCFAPYSRFYGFCKSSSSTSKDTLESILSWGPLIFFILYFWECCKSSSQAYLKSNMEIPDYETFLKEIKASPPQLGTKVECYHYEKPSEKEGLKITYTGSWYFNYKSWEDTTGQIVGMNEGKIIKLHLTKSHSFGNTETQKKFEEDRKHFIKMNEKRDEEMDEVSIFEIGGFQSHVLVQNKNTSRPSCMSDCWYWFWSCLLLSWPYRMWFEHMTVTKRIDVRKTIYGYTDTETIL